MSILPTWPIAAGALVVGLAIGAYADHKVMGARIDRMEAATAEQERVRQVQRAADERTSRTNEQRIVEAAGKTLQEKEDEKNRIVVERDAALASLRARPDRKPASAGTVPAAPAACQGATGADLSRQDAEFLVFEAARADGVRAALEQCYGQYEAARAIVNAPASTEQ